MHLKSCQHRADTLPPMVSIKAEVVEKVDLDNNENCIDDKNEGISVKEEVTTEVGWCISFPNFPQCLSYNYIVKDF